MALAGFKRKMLNGWELDQPIDLNVAYIPPPETSIHPEAMEAVRRITSSGSMGRVDLRNRPKRAALTPRDPNQVGHTTGAAMAGPSNQRAGLLQSQFETTKQTILSRSLHHAKLAVTIKFPQSESCVLAPGTCLYYMPRPSITSKGYVNAHTVEALSLLADVSCKVKRTHIQRSCNVSPRLSESKGCVNARTVEALSLLADVSCEALKRRDILRSRNLTSKLSGNEPTYKERSNQTPLQKKMASLLKNLQQLKEQFTDKHTQLKITDSYRVVRKLRTPRRPSMPAFRCPTKLQKNMSLSKCDEIVSRIRGSSASCADAAHLRDRLALTDTSTITSAEKDMIGEGKFPDNKSTSRIASVPLAAQSTATLERVSKSLSQISVTKKSPYGRSMRSERFTNQILQFIGEGALPEKLIRQTLGNNPDTSKALRLLLTERKVKRLGSGGRSRPYEYVATEKGLLHIHGVKHAVSEVVELTPESVSSCNPISGTRIVSDGPKSDAQCLPTQVTNSPEASASVKKASQPHCCLQWPLTQTQNGVVSSQSVDLLSSGITEC